MTSTSSTLDHSRSLRRRGALVLAAFALLWGMVGASGLPADARAAGRLAALLITAALLLLVAGPGRTAHERERRQPADWHRRVGQVNLAEAALIAVIVVTAGAADAPQLVPPLVALVVGLHFLPLARLFDQPEYLATAAGLVLGAALGLGALAVGTSDETSRLLVGAVAAVTLWLTSLRLTALTALTPLTAR